MRGAGLPVEAMIEYVKLCQQGDSTIEARMLLLKEQMETLLEQKAQIESTIKRLDFKISRYEEAVRQENYLGINEFGTILKSTTLS